MPSGADLGRQMIRQSMPAKPAQRQAVAKAVIGFVLLLQAKSDLHFNFYPKSSVVLTLPVTGAGAITFKLNPVLNTNPQITATVVEAPKLGPAGGVPLGAFRCKFGSIAGAVIGAAYTLTVNQNGLPIVGEPVLKLTYDGVFGWTPLKALKSAGNLDVDGGLRVRTGGVEATGAINTTQNIYADTTISSGLGGVSTTGSMYAVKDISCAGNLYSSGLAVAGSAEASGYLKCSSFVLDSPPSMGTLGVPVGVSSTSTVTMVGNKMIFQLITHLPVVFTVQPDPDLWTRTGGALIATLVPYEDASGLIYRSPNGNVAISVTNQSGKKFGLVWI